MPKTPLRPKDVLEPHRVLDNLLNDYIQGQLDDNNFLYRVLVTKIDTIGGQLEKEEDGATPNPKNSIKGRIITAGYDSATPEEALPVFWPLFPFQVMPIKEGEHVYVIFEDNINKQHGLWITRVPENKRVDQRNLVLRKKEIRRQIQQKQYF
jgi:hypothetical protein